MYNSKQETLSAMSPIKRKKIITYFISAKTRVKLDAADRSAFSNVTRTIQEKKAGTLNLIGISAGIFASMALTKPVAVNIDAAVCCGYFSRFLYSNHPETKFMFEGHLVQNLTLNY
jgi:hypothetical protein